MPSKDEEASGLATKHYEIELGMTQIFRLAGPADAELNPTEPIKLLEVNENTVPSGIMPLWFGPSPASGFHYPSVIIEVTPEEYERIRKRDLELPNGWKIADLIPRPETAGHP